MPSLIPAADGRADPARKLVIEGNKAWKAAAEVRKRWLANELFARRTAPREAAPFITRQLLSMPDPFRSGLAAAPGRLLFSEITGHYAERWLETCDTAPAGRLPLLMLGPIVTAYEQAMTEGEGKNTWRTDRYSPCPRSEAGPTSPSSPASATSCRSSSGPLPTASPGPGTPRPKTRCPLMTTPQVLTPRGPPRSRTPEGSPVPPAQRLRTGNRRRPPSRPGEPQTSRTSASRQPPDSRQRRGPPALTAGGPLFFRFLVNPSARQPRRLAGFSSRKDSR